MKKIKYAMDKETKGTFRFQPADGADSELANATIYLPKSFVAAAGINPAKGFMMTIEAVE